MEKTKPVSIFIWMILLIPMIIATPRIAILLPAQWKRFNFSLNSIIAPIPTHTEERLTINVGNVVLDTITAVFQNTSSNAKNMPPSNERQIPFKFMSLLFARI